MRKETEMRHGRHCVFNMYVHVVLVTKYCGDVFTTAILNDLCLILNVFAMTLMQNGSSLTGKMTTFIYSLSTHLISIIRQYIEQQQTSD